MRNGRPTLAAAGLTLGISLAIPAWAQLPSVISATPASVQLVVGGAPVTVTLGGIRLDHAWGARVLLVDTPVPPVTADLGPPIGPTERTIVLQAGPAAPVGTYVVQLMVGSRALPVPLHLAVVRARSAAPGALAAAGH